MFDRWAWLWFALGAVASVASTVSSKAAGGVWLALVMLGLGAAFGRKNKLALSVHAPSEQARWASHVFLWVCGLALALRTVGMLYWGDSWQERHAELRLLLLALAVWAWVRKGQLPLRAPAPWLEIWTHGFALACLLGFVQVWRVGREHLTTHPIAWAVGVSMLSIWLLHSAVWRVRLSWQRWVWLLGGVCGVLAVLTSQSRGAYGLVLWWLGVLAWQARLALRNRQTSHRDTPSLAILALTLIVPLVLWGSGLWQRPVVAVQQAVAEFELNQRSTADASETSFGARLYMWQRTVPALEQAPIWGYGQDGRRELIHQWGHDVDSQVVQSLGHAHNQYLNDMLDHGMWGLASGLTYILGLGWLALGLLKRQLHFTGWTIGGVVFMHTTASLSNVNFAHNYYPTVMAVVVGLAVVSLRESVPR